MLNYETNELETLILKTIENSFYMDTKCIKESKSKRNEFKMDREFATILSNTNEELGDYPTNKILTAIETMFEKENGKFKNLAKKENKGFSSPIEFVLNYISKSMNFEYNEYLEKFQDIGSGQELLEADLMSRVYESNWNYKTENDEAYSNDRLKNCLCLFKNQNYHQKITDIRTNIKYKEDYEMIYPALEDLLDELFDAMNITPDFVESNYNVSLDNFREIGKLVLKQTFWLIKRNIFSLPTKNEIMLFFYGPQGTGKTYVMDRIFQTVFKELYVPAAKLDMLTDNKQVELFSRKFVINFDEAASKNGKMDNAAMAEIKTILTQKTITYRPMGTNSSVEVDKKFTAVATTNKEMKEVLQDKTGYRRFFQLSTDNVENQLFDDSYFDGDDIENKITMMWQLIDETDNNGYLFDQTNPLVIDLQKIQSTYVNLTTFDMFCLDSKLALADERNNPDYQEVGSTDLYTSYKAYCVSNNMDKIKTKKNFLNDIESKKIFTIHKTHRNGKPNKCFLVGVLDEA